MFYFADKEQCCQICTCSLWFYFNLFVCVHFCNELKSFSHWNILVLCVQWKMMSDLNISHGKRSDFFFIFIVWVHFSHKTEKFLFSESLKYLIYIFWSKNMMEIWFIPVKQCLIWFKLRCLSKVLTKSWKIRILNFIFLN